RLISGIPPWVQMYYETLLDYTGKEHVLDVFPNYSVFVYGGVNFEPYRQTLERLVGDRIDSVELYPASEGFIAFQDAFPSEGLLLNTDLGMYYEFIPLSEFSSEDPQRLGLHEVEMGVDYVLVISSNAGLWAYNIGDTVSFTSLSPYRIIVSGRVKHFISAFGEHVIAKEVERAMIQATQKYGVDVVEFTVAPQVSPQEGKLPYHEWLVEFSEKPEDLTAFSNDLDREMCEQNIYYKDLIEGKILRPLKVTSLQQGVFRRYMESQGKLGGQNKVPRLSNDRAMAEKIMKL
ncbi:MAG TPA: GH3 auxin-responsive promoter family protein, partial [Saprospiraceae bacterium]|nr:GH3 auxin-responsive promoter family protein [Saprospiraceae bacterium]